MPRALLALVLLVSASTALAAEKSVKIGFLSFWPGTMSAHVDYLREALEELGYKEGRNIEIEAYFTGGDPSLTREMARVLIAKPVDLIVAQVAFAARTSGDLTRTIPIVMAPSINPVEAGLVNSLSHPGGNITGISTQETDYVEKWVQYLRDIRPGLRTIGFIGRAGSKPSWVPMIRAAIDRAGMGLVVSELDGPEAISVPVLESLKREGAEALLVQSVFAGYQGKIIPLANDAGLPVVSGYADFAEAGGLLTYGIDAHAMMRRAAGYIDRILKGAKPADLPVEQPTAIQLTINVRATKLFGWTIPQSLLLQADRIIE